MRFVFQATKGVWWMPWGKVPMKDAIAAILSGELQTGFDPEVSEWGNPARVMPGHSLMNT